MHFPTTLRRPVLAIAAAFSLAAAAAPASATTILFVGNSFTFGDPAGGQPLVKNYKPDTVTDLNGTKIGGVPALFKAFTVQVGLNYDVSLETQPGQGVDWHYKNKLATLTSKPWDKVLLQSYSTLDSQKPGNPATLIKYSGMLAQAFHDKNPNVDVRLTSTWSRADQTYKPGGAWYGQSIYQMALDVRAGYDKADLASDLISDVIPVGQAWNRAIMSGLADANPFDGVDTGINLWAPDSYHASIYGYYLEALTIFGNVTGLDPRSLGAGETAARDLGITPQLALSLQALAAAQLEAEAVPEPGMALMFGTLGGMMLLARRRKGARAGRDRS